MAVVSIQSSRWANTVAINKMVATGKTENKNIRVYSSMFEMTGCISKQTRKNFASELNCRDRFIALNE